MAGIRPGGLSDDEYSDEDQILDCDETVSKQFSNSDKVAATLRGQVGSMYSVVVVVLLLLVLDTYLQLA